ncbi:MAG: hypothetical protein JWM86_2503, partial [Thermoleophilia bacterium]|nr:hypothetical protein [Thermoleophilia bacterium]
VEATPVEQMTQDINRQVQRHPLMFAAGMFGAGFALMRAFKPVSSSAQVASTSTSRSADWNTASTSSIGVGSEGGSY